MIIIFEKTEINFDNLGLGVLTPKSCTVTEELNGLYELALEHPFDDLKKFELLEKERVILAKTPNGYQPFRIYKINPTLDGITVNARHIFYDLLDNYIPNLITEGDASSVLTQINNNLSFGTNFKFKSDINKIGKVVVERENPISALLGEDKEKPKFIQSFGGEILRDKFNIKILNNIGSDKGYTVRYGKNLLGLKIEEDYSSVVTRVYAVGKDGLTLPEKYVDSPKISEYLNPKISYVEFSEADNIDNLRTEAENYLKSMHTPKVNITVDFINLKQTREYSNFQFLETVNLGDTVSIFNQKLKFSKKSKVISYEYDSINDNFINLTLGEFADFLTDSITRSNSSTKKLEQSSNQINQTLGGATKIIDGVLYVADNANFELAKIIYKFDSDGISKSTTGINGPFMNILK